MISLCIVLQPGDFMVVTKIGVVAEIGDLMPVSILNFLGGLELRYYLIGLGVSKIHPPK